MDRGSLDSINPWEFVAALSIALVTGMIRFLMFVRKSRGKFRWFDLALEPLLAVLGGMLVWAINVGLGTPEVVRMAFVSVGAWAGPRAIHFYERKLFGGTRATDTKTGDLDEETR